VTPANRMTPLRSPGSVLIVDDELKIRQLLAKALAEEGHDVVAIDSARAARQLLGTRIFDVLLVDNQMPEVTGLDLIRDITSTVPESERPQILMMTAHATVESALAAMKLGALDYLQKPFEIDELVVVVERAVEHQRLRGQHGYLLAERDEDFDHYGIVGKSKLMQDAVRTAGLVAQTKSTTLITGETGTGKELIARAIHAKSSERERPLIKINCAAIPESLLESELFGHVKGAFTGAVANKKGRFALADGGSIFLDEIATMSQALQAKLLRVLQEREFEPLGSERTQKVDVRVIAATNANLEQLVEDGSFRQDLFYRLNVVRLRLPPLRERRDDVLPLAAHFLGRHARLRPDLTGLALGDDAREALLAHRWPGNVRELEHALERAVVLADGPLIHEQDLPDAVRAPAHPLTGPDLAAGDLSVKRGTRALEERLIRAALERTGGNRTRAAELLDLSYRALLYKIRDYGLGS
jgi:two-component system, NtrC family, response regulator AtoC